MDTPDFSGIEPTEAVYDGFMSYSHAADGLLAPRLQSALQRFAKPWWKRRAVRIFRDESSLSANPHLWSSITNALDASGWFILLLSPDAATSEWVNREIDYWVTNRNPHKILPVVTDGTFGWTDGDVDGDAVPPALAGVFAAEPRWVDLRFARDEEQLDLKNPRFSAAVADIASAVRGISKDELESEEVKQHRRTTRIAWAAGALVTILALTAAAFGIQAAGNAELARSRELAAEAVNAIEDDPELAALLAIHAASIGGDELPAATEDALWRAGLGSNLVQVVDLGYELFTTIDVSSDGTRLAVGLMGQDETGKLELRDAMTMDVLWDWIPTEGEGVANPSFSPDGRRLAVPILAREPEDQEEAPTGARLEIVDVATGSSIKTIRYDGCAFAGAPVWSPDGASLALTTAWLPCERVESTTGKWVELFDTETWDSTAVSQLPANRFGSFPAWTAEGQLYVFGDHQVRRYAPELSSYENLDVDGFGDVSPDGSLVATYSIAQNVTAVYDAVDLAVVDRIPWEAFPRFPVGISFTDDGDSLFVATEGHETHLYSLNTGQVELELPSGRTEVVIRDETSGRIYTSHEDGTIKVWSANAFAFGMVSADDLGDAEWVNGNAFRHGDGISSVYHLGARGFASFFDQTSGRFVFGPVESWGTPEPIADGRFVWQPDAQHVEIIDPRNGERTPVAGCSPPGRILSCQDPPEPGIGVMVSLDGTEIALIDLVENESGTVVGRNWTLFDLNGRMVGNETHPDMAGWVGFSDQAVVYRESDEENFVAIDRETNEVLWRANDLDPQVGAVLTERGVEVIESRGLTIIDPTTGAREFVPADLERPRGWEFSPDQRRLALADEDRLVVIDVSEGTELARIPLAGASDFHWMDDTHVLVGTRTGVWGVLPIDDRLLLQDARDSVRRTFSDSECELYEIDPCPTLEEMRGG